MQLRRSVLAVLALAVSSVASAIVPPSVPEPLTDRQLVAPALRVSPRFETDERLGPAGRLPAERARGLASFRREAGGSWTALVDQLGGEIALLEGSGLPMIPGTANSLAPGAFGLVAGGAPDLPTVARLSLDLLGRHRGLVGAPGAELRLDVDASGPMLDYLYFVQFDWYYGGVPVDGAGVSFRLNHGNLVQLATERIGPSIRSLRTDPTLPADSAWKVVSDFVGSGRDEILEPGRLVILPVSSPPVVAHLDVRTGEGIDYRLVWILGFRREGETGTFEAKVDAHTGELLSFVDTNDYGLIRGGVYTQDGFTGEAVRTFPYADHSGGNADGAGAYPGTSGACTMSGTYVDITDYCGTILLASDATGLIDFGSGNGTNCTTPGKGGAGNTHASRTQYWNVTQIKLKAKTYLSRAWLNASLVDRVNMTSAQSAYCPGNAWWDGTRLNFCVSGGGYNNTGELPGVSLHEWGHGMDENDGNNASPDNGTGETYGDFSAALQTHASCIGAGFMSGNCGGYGDSCKSCSGVRDIDYAKHQSNSPHTPANFTGVRCPYRAGYSGPCGLEGHCESYVSSEAAWDLAARDLVTWGLDATSAWQTMDRLWYASRGSATAAFTCNSSTFASNGCGGGSLFSVFRVVDDCDGNLANGTPHASAIWNAFNRHAIGCSTVVNTDQTSCCPTLTAPTLSATAGSNPVALSWTAVTNAVTYDVYRNEVGCTSGFTKVASVTAPQTSYSDANVAPTTTYYYRVQAVASSAACTGPMSNCQTVTSGAGGGACTAPGAPNLTSAAGGCGGVDLAWAAGTGTTASYNVYRSGACGSGYVRIAGPITGTTYTDGTATVGTTYAYAIKGSCNSGGTTESAFSNCRTAAASDVPSAPAAPTVTDSCAGVSVSWVADPVATGYDVQRRNGGCGNNGWAAIASGLAGTTFVDTTAASGSTYGYYVVASNACGAAGVKGNCTVATHSAGPAAPGGVAASDSTDCTQVAVTWNAVSGATSYRVHRAASCGGAATLLGSPTATSWNDTTAVAGTAYQYWVAANNGSCDGPVSACDAGTRSTGPASPGGVAATDGTDCTKTTITWSSVAGATTYRVYRAATCGAASTLVGSTAALTLDDTSGVAGTVYQYWVVASNGVCDSAPSGCNAGNRASVPAAATGVAASDGTDCAQVSVSWNAVAGATSYDVYRSSSCGGASTLLGSPAATGWNDGTAVAGTTYQYWVVASAGSCDGPVSACDAGTRGQATSAPTGVVAASSCATGTTVSWNASAGATSYQVLRAAGASCSGAALVGSPAAPPFTDATAVPGVQYSWQVFAVGSCGNSTASACSTATAAGTQVLFSDDFEAGGAAWTLATAGNDAKISVIAAAPGNGTQVLAGENNNRTNRCVAATLTTPVTIGAGVVSAKLRFWSQSALLGGDAARVEVSTDAGASWNALSTVAYPAASGAALSCTPAIGVGDGVFSGAVGAASYSADLSAYRGMTLRLRFRFATSGTGNAASRWYVDDVVVEQSGGTPVASLGNGVRLARNGSNADLSWTAVAGATGYNVWSTSDPAVNPWPASATAPPAGWARVNASEIPGTTWAHAGGASAGGNTTYVVTSVSCTREQFAP